MSEDKKKDNYGADSIQALEGMEHVRMRPSMYIGDVKRRFEHLFFFFKRFSFIKVIETSPILKNPAHGLKSHLNLYG
ncbi:MAG TPA: hypothetical protein EYP87_06405 [Flavobacteriaceae bacterium]|nr:hypothetical protein [Flavobacteriaceae bacterium]